MINICVAFSLDLWQIVVPWTILYRHFNELVSVPVHHILWVCLSYFSCHWNKMSNSHNWKEEVILVHFQSSVEGFNGKMVWRGHMEERSCLCPHMSSSKLKNVLIFYYCFTFFINMLKIFYKLFFFSIRHSWLKILIIIS